MTERIQRNIAIMLMVVGLQPAIASAEPPPDYRLAWHDEFDRLSIGPPGSTANWLPYFVRWGARHLPANQDQAIKMADGETASDGATVADVLERAGVGPHGSGFMHEIRDGALLLRAYSLPAELSSNFWGFRYIGAMVSGEERYSQRHGYWEVRLQLDNVGPGQHFSIWLLPTDGSWPPEIDLLEVVGLHPNTVFLNAHGAKPQLPITSWSDGDLTRNWLTVGFLWTPTVMRWTINGMTRREQPNFIDGQKLYFLMSWEVGDRWSGPPDANSVWPAQSRVDYVRIYQAPDGTEPARN
jgi:hypothetical protein